MFEGLFNFANLSNHLVLIGIYMLLAMSLNLINGSLGAFSLGHHAFWGMGAYAAGAFVWKFGAVDGGALVFTLSFVVGMAASALFGLVVGLPCLRLRGDYLAIATLGFAEIFAVCVRNSETWTVFDSVGEEARGLGGSAGFCLGDGFKGGNDFAIRMAGLQGRQIFYLVLTAVLVTVVYFLIRNFMRTAHGRAVLAIREDETAAELLGVNLPRYKVFVFVFGAALAGLAGALFANFRSGVVPSQFVMMEGVKILLMCVLGGLGSFSGTLLAVIVLYASEQALGTLGVQVPFPMYSSAQGFVWVSKSLSDLWQVVFALILIVLMLTRPQGLMGSREFSRAFFRDLFERWRANPMIPVLTLAQWIALLASLALAGKSVWPVALGIAAFAGLQWAKRRWMPSEARAA